MKDKLREAIIKACPDIMERYFDCSIDRNHHTGYLKITDDTIRLADVLRAIEKLNDVHSTIMSYKKTSKMKKVSVIIDILRLWNLKEPLSGQSEETIQFLKDILL